MGVHVDMYFVLYTCARASYTNAHKRTNRERQWPREEGEELVSGGACIKVSSAASEFIIHVLGVKNQGSRGTPLEYGDQIRLQSRCTGEYLKIKEPIKQLPTSNPPAPGFIQLGSATTNWDGEHNILNGSSKTNDAITTFLVKNPEDWADTSVVKCVCARAHARVCLSLNLPIYMHGRICA